MSPPALRNHTGSTPPITRTRLRCLGSVQAGWLNEIVNGWRGVTPSTALRLAKAFGTSPQLWLNGQLAVDLYRASHDEEQMRAVEQIEPIRHVS